MTSSPASVSPLGGEARLPVPFEDLLRAHRRELLVHCYRMLGSWTDAEDVFQDVSLRAWRGLDRFEGRASARSWLYRIATNACLTALRGRSQRTLPDVSMPAAPVGGPLAPLLEEARWIQPFPTGPDVEAVASSRESVTLAFVLALQHLPPRQRAVLLLREVVGYEASEVAAMLMTSTPAVNSALIRARARMARFRGRHGVEARIAPLSPGQQQLLRSYVRAWEAGDVDAIVALFSRDASVSMPPFATWYRGRVAIARWLSDQALADGRTFRLFPTFANGRPAFAFYKSGGPCLPGEPAHDAFEPHCIQVVWLARGRVTRIVSFLNPQLVKEFGFGPRLPRGRGQRPARGRDA
jgi:RNA polymerase sigma-70 factor (ECF subfamily)